MKIKSIQLKTPKTLGKDVSLIIRCFLNITEQYDLSLIRTNDDWFEEIYEGIYAANKTFNGMPTIAISKDILESQLGSISPYLDVIIDVNYSHKIVNADSVDKYNVNVTVPLIKTSTISNTLVDPETDKILEKVSRNLFVLDPYVFYLLLEGRINYVRQQLFKINVQLR